MEKHIKSILLFIFICSTTVVAQDTTFQKKQRLNFQTQFFQIKEAANYGLVFNGLNFVFGYDFTNTANHRLLNYSADIAVGIDYKKGAGLNWHLKPLDVFYGFELNTGTGKTCYLGPYLAVNYQWQVYPELQSGHMFWFTFMDVGPKLVYQTPMDKEEFRFALSNSVAGLASRQIPETETHFYSLEFSEFISNAHQDLKAGSFSLLNHTRLEVEWLNVNKKRSSLSYAFEYFGYFDDPELNYITHSIILHWFIGKYKKSLK